MSANALESPNPLIDKRLHKRLVRNTASLGCMFGATQEVFRNAQRDLRRRLVERLQNFALKVLVA